jgi:hypothetical protein
LKGGWSLLYGLKGFGILGMSGSIQSYEEIIRAMANSSFIYFLFFSSHSHGKEFISQVQFVEHWEGEY